MRLLLSLSIAILFISCMPSRRVAQNRIIKYVKQYPDLSVLSQDTLHFRDTIAGISIDTTFSLPQTNDLDLNGTIASYDKIMSDCKAFAVYKDSIILKLRAAIRKQGGSPLIKDTIRFIKDGVSVKVFMRGRELGFKITKPLVLIDSTLLVASQTISGDSPPSFWDKLTFYGFWILLGLAVLCIVLFFFRKNL